LDKKDVSEVILLSDTLPNGKQYPTTTNPKLKLFDSWSFNSYISIFRMLKTINATQPDIVLFNIQFLSFGDKKIPAALGLMLPMWLRMKGKKVVVLLHNIMEEVDLSNAGITQNRLLAWVFNFIGTFLTKCILKANLVTLTISKYVEVLEKKYEKTNVALIPHGAFEVPPFPDLDAGAKPWSVMAFGKFGTYKKVEILIEATQMLRKKLQQPIKVVIAGTDNPNCIGYLESVREQFKDMEDLHFTGYVAEEDVPRIFTDCTLTVFPYTGTTGSSGILHQAGSYGKAVVLPDIGDLSKLVKEEGYRGEFFEPENVESLASAMEKVLTNDEYRRALGEKNYLASASLPMADIADWYLLHFKELLKKK
jgi:glycosyltransferase involved in cell wall biosynthesis